MNDFSPKSAGYDYPRDESDELLTTTNQALGLVPQLHDIIAQQRKDTLQLHERLQRANEQRVMMQMGIMELQAQITSHKFVPVIPAITAQAGLLSMLPVHAMTSLDMLRELGADGSVREHFSARFDPADLVRAYGERDRQRSEGIARIQETKKRWQR
jgi:hypothetical protein